MNDNEYYEFLKAKHAKADAVGFDWNDRPAWMSGGFEWQWPVTQWALKQGRAALFEDCGLGKTSQELAIADACVKHTGKPALIVTPLCVAYQFIDEAKHLGVETPIVISQDGDASGGIVVTNYERIERFTPSDFSCVILDESSILKSYMGKTKRALVDMFGDVPYRFAATATPSPNDHMELGNHAEFLGVMKSNEMLSRWFINDLEKMGTYRLMKHGEADFWRWVASWAVCIQTPSDIGYPADGYTLPCMEIVNHVIETPDPTPQDGELFGGAIDPISATTVHKVKRGSTDVRAAKAAELVASFGDEPCVVWCDTNYEADALLKVIPHAVDVRGNHTPSAKEAAFRGFTDGSVRVLITKPEIGGFGLNWQHCNRCVYVGLSFSYERFYQSVRRFYRFGQKRNVEAHIICTDAEVTIGDTVSEKAKRHEEMKTAMSRAMSGFTQQNLKGALRLAHNTDIKTHEGEGWKILHGDCVDAMRDMPADCMDFTIFSPPFAQLYIYSDSIADMGNAADAEEFMRHYHYFANELIRVVVPGRLVAVHCKDLPKYYGRDGEYGLYDFPADLTKAMEVAGFTYHSKVTIWKCPVVERERTNTHGLLHKTVKRDTSGVRQGMPDYLLLFRKRPTEGLTSDKPIERPDGFTEYVGDPDLDPRVYTGHPSPFARTDSLSRGKDSQSVTIWRRYAEPVWWDVQQTDTLNFKLARGDSDEKHICPLQLGLIRKALHIWSMPGETVFSPFAGVGSEGYVSLQEGRKFIGCELKENYVQHAVNHMKLAVSQRAQLEMF